MLSCCIACSARLLILCFTRSGLVNGKADLVNGKAHASYGGGGGGGGLDAGVAPWVTIDLPAHDSKLQT